MASSGQPCSMPKIEKRLAPAAREIAHSVVVSAEDKGSPPLSLAQRCLRLQPGPCPRLDRLAIKGPQRASKEDRSGQ
jgi:hypothetical protein